MTRKEILDKVERGFELYLVAMLTRECPHLPSTWTRTLARHMAGKAREFFPPHVAITYLPEMIMTEVEVTR